MIYDIINDLIVRLFNHDWPVDFSIAGGRLACADSARQKKRAQRTRLLMVVVRWEGGAPKISKFRIELVTRI